MKNIYMKIILSVLIRHSTHIIGIAALGIGSRELGGDIHFWKAITKKSNQKERRPQSTSYLPSVFSNYLFVTLVSKSFIKVKILEVALTPNKRDIYKT